jgi:hypothetical protein
VLALCSPQMFGSTQVLVKAGKCFYTELGPPSVQKFGPLGVLMDHLQPIIKLQNEVFQKVEFPLIIN